MNHFPFLETAIEFLPNLSQELGVNIYVKRDDAFQLAGGGNKARKLQYILYKAIRENYNAIVTAGDLNSNHNRATAMMGAKLGMKVKLIVHNDHPENEIYSKNMYISRLCGAEVTYCTKNDVAVTMDQSIENFVATGFKPFYIWGGGHSLEGTYAYYDATKHISRQCFEKSKLDYVFFASGTGTTHAGIHVGMKQFFPETKVSGISIARQKDRGTIEIHKSIVELEKYLNINTVTNINSIIFDDQFILGGYESFSEELFLLIKKIAQEEGVLLDPTYSGKAFWGMINQIKGGLVPQKSNVLFWHTGGIFNLISNQH